MSLCCILNSRLFSEIQHDLGKQTTKRKIEDVDKKIPNTKNLVNKTAFNTKATDIENKMPNISNIIGVVFAFRLIMEEIIRRS